ncbi:type II toxin-antitoxin system Phd/YefM family antitoxin [Desulfurispora thermophila]|uniref:type II toxin-antitoxin system Phd/YefM family antitoxin n=1 Tax=Desulfurispora thermophila TaxID=265470 RepID=UPI00037876F6|nr:type II toxin-antitoxin system prevent-host-death family antitoxin [Desulfurispora thermophila]
MRMVNVTDLRVSIRKVLLEISKTREPVAILQRSRPVAYLIDAETFENMQKASGSELEMLKKARIERLGKIAQLRAKIARRGKWSDSTQIVRELRERPGRHE